MFAKHARVSLIGSYASKSPCLLSIVKRESGSGLMRSQRDQSAVCGLPLKPKAARRNQADCQSQHMRRLQTAPFRIRPLPLLRSTEGRVCVCRIRHGEAKESAMSKLPSVTWGNAGTATFVGSSPAAGFLDMSSCPELHRASMR